VKYKVGDKVRIRTDLICNSAAQACINQLNDRTTVVRKIYKDKYILKRVGVFEWREDCLEGFHDPINSRWEILDL